MSSNLGGRSSSGERPFFYPFFIGEIFLLKT